VPKIQYRKYRPRPLSIQVIATCNKILKDYTDQNLDLTLRQLHYQLVANDLYPDEWIDEEYNEKMGLHPETKNTDKNYDRLGNLIVAAREGGMVDWDHIKDRGRNISRFAHWRDPTHFINHATRQFSIDMWADQPKRVEVWVEKDALSQVIENAADPFDCPTFATKGYMSASAAWDAGHNRFLKWAQEGQDIVILHLSDHDPSGIHMSQDVQERIDMFSRAYIPDQLQCNITVKRIALTMDQVQQYDPPSNPAKDTDSRKPAYVAQFGVNESWELDALDPPVLVALIQQHIREEMDESLYDLCRDREAADSSMLRTVASNWTSVVRHLRDEDLLDDDLDEGE
jgi:hypothetical protein